MTAHKFPLSQKYRDFIRSIQGVTAEFLEGTTASGKTTVGAGVKFMYMVSASPKRLHIIAAKTTGIAEKNIIQQENGILDLHRNAVYCGNGDRNNKLPHIKFEGKLIYVLGYDNKDKWENVLGSQFGCVYIDEINTADIDFVREISTRNDYLLATLNPDDPSLPVYQEFVNRSRPCARYAAQEQAWRKRLNSLVKENSDVLRMDYRRLKVYDAPVPPAGKTAAVPPTPKPKAAKAKVHTEGGSAGRAVEVTPPATKDNVGYSLEKIEHEEDFKITKKNTSNGFSVNRELVNAKQYHDKFSDLTEHKATNESVYQQAKRILEDRDGKDTERMAIIDARTGELLTDNLSVGEDSRFKTGLSFEKYQKIKESGKRFLILHNHPSSTRPSITDILTFWKEEKADASIVVGHDGTVYVITDMNRKIPLDKLYEMYYYSYKELGYDVDMARLKATNDIYASKAFTYLLIGNEGDD